MGFYLILLMSLLLFLIPSLPVLGWFCVFFCNVEISLTLTHHTHNDLCFVPNSPVQSMRFSFILDSIPFDSRNHSPSFHSHCVYYLKKLNKLIVFVVRLRESAPFFFSFSALFCIGNE